MNDLRADHLALRTSPVFELRLDLSGNLRNRNKEVNAYQDAQELADGGLDDLTVVQLDDEQVLECFRRISWDHGGVPKECLLTINLKEVRTFKVRPTIEQGSLFLDVLRADADVGLKNSENCLRCGAVLFFKNPLPAGGWAMDPATQMALESEEDEQFFRCPKCGAKNAVIDGGGAGPGTTLTLAYVLDEQS
jgi:DNA-directed RNA polymerase subunit RPC12/RpoP